MALLFAGSAVNAQSTPPPPAQYAKWRTTLGAGLESDHGSYQEACRAQWAAFNPNATYQSASLRADNPNVADCHWLGSQNGGPNNANTTLPAGVYLVVPVDYVLGSDGNLLPVWGQHPDCNCATQPQSAPKPEVVGNPVVGDPIDLNSGAQIESARDYASADGLFTVDRIYRSNGRGVSVGSLTDVAGFGWWRGVIPGQLTFRYGAASFSNAEFLHASAGVDRFDVSNANDPASFTYVGDPTTRVRLTFLTTGGQSRADFLSAPANAASTGEVRLDMPNGDYLLFRRGTIGAYPNWRQMIVTEEHKASGYTRFLDYQNGDNVPYRIRDSFGRQMLLQWQAVERLSPCWNNDCNANPSAPYASGRQPKITRIDLPDGTALTYSYDRAARAANTESIDDRLVSMRRLSATGTVVFGRNYVYDQPLQPYALTGILDQNGARLNTFAYNSAGQSILAERAGGVDRYTVTHGYFGSFGFQTGDERVVTNPLGLVTTYNFAANWWEQWPRRLTSITTAATPNIPAQTRTSNFPNNLLADQADARGVNTHVDNDALGRPTVVRAADGRPEQQGTNLTWHPTFDLPTSETRGNLRLDYQYDAQGRLTQLTQTDLTTQTIPYSTNGQTRTWTYGWAATGRLLSVNGPRAPDALARDDTETYTYDAAGNLLTVKNGLNQTTTYANYDLNGRPGQMTDANGIVTQFIYDALGRMTSASVRAPGTGTAHATTSFEYDIEGRVIGITRPATARLGMTYSLAGRLQTVSAPTGEAINFTYDAMGNVTRRRVTNAAGVQRSQVDRTFDEMGRMLTETLGPGRTRTYAYDATGNPTQITSARNFATTQAFDGLARLTSAVMPDSGTIANSFNSNDDLTAHTDAAAVTTSFVFNGFGEVIREVSPDRGTSTYTYNSAGDLLSATDGRGQRIDYTYDILGRVLTRTPAGLTAQRVTYAYDTAAIAGSYNVGRLSSVTDGSGTTKYAYDHRGNVLTVQQVISASSIFTSSYSYDLADRISRITYPSGRWVDYARDAQGRVLTVTTRASGATTTTTLASAMTYEPFGALTSATWGNTQRFAQIFDAYGRRTERRWRASNNTTNIWDATYAYDNEDNITGITDVVTPANNQIFQYDPVERLSRVDLSTGSNRRDDYVFDANGNRIRVEHRATTTTVSPTSSDSYTRTAGTNRLASIATTAGTRTETYDARGNLSAESRPGSIAVTTSYDGFARLTGYTRTGQSALAMQYNGLDQRVMFTRGTGGTAVTRRMVQDRDGRLLGEYGTAGTQIFTEYIWLLPETSDGAQTYGGDDGTGGWTPLAVVTAPGNTTQTLLFLRSSHLGVPTGSTNATGTTTAIATGTTLLGFPGQQQTLADLYYNQYRDYDTVTGRYIQADPLGLDGDSNPYAYAGGNPVRFSDALGLECVILFTQPDFVRAAQRQCELIDRPDTLNVFGHGGPHYICRGLGRLNLGECMNARQFRNTYRTPERQARIRNITFWGCNTGRIDDGLAQLTANLWRVPVRAPSLWTWWSPTRGYTGVADIQRTWREWLRDIFGEAHGFPPHHTGPRGAAGEWRVFQPK